MFTLERNISICTVFIKRKLFWFARGRIYNNETTKRKYWSIFFDSRIYTNILISYCMVNCFASSFCFKSDPSTTINENKIHQCPGVYITFEIHILHPFQPFFCNFIYFKSIGEKICILFSNWGKICIFLLFLSLGKICIFLLFLSLFNNFFPPTCYLAIFQIPGGRSNRKIYTPVNVSTMSIMSTLCAK